MVSLSHRLVVEAAVHGGTLSVVPLARQDAQVSSSEAGVAQGVTHRVDCTVDVAQVVEEVPQTLRYTVHTRGQRFHQH